MKILITGVAGLVGSNLAKHLLKKGHDVIGIDDLSGSYIEHVPGYFMSSIGICHGYSYPPYDKELNFYKDNCCDAPMMDLIFSKERPDIVYHAAAYAAENLSPFIRKFNYENNLIATAIIVNNCIKYDVKRLVYFSSIAVYGHGSPPFNENDIPFPNDPYGNAKFCSENDIRIAGEQHDLDWCVVRPYNLYGPGQNIWDRYRNVLGIWMNQYMKGEKLTIFGSGSQQRAFTYIDDVLEPLYLAGTSKEASKQIINVGSSFKYTVLDACNILISIMGGGEIQHLPPRHEVEEAYCSILKSNKILHYKNVVHLKDGIEKMWQWALQQPKRESFTWPSSELDKNMYLFWKK